MTYETHGIHTTMTVVSDPLRLFAPGDEYSRSEIAAWLEEEELPVGLVLRNGREWTVCDDGERLLLRDKLGRTLDAQGVRLLSARGAPRASTRLDVLRALHDLTAAQGYPPTYREIGRRIGRRVSLVRYHIEILSEEGFVDRTPFVHRSAMVTEAGMVLLNEKGE